MPPLRSAPHPHPQKTAPSWHARLLSWSPLHRLHAWKTQSQYLGRYSIEKLCAFHHYQETTSFWRVACVILTTPLPTFLLLLLLDVVPMNDPRAGASQNAVAFTRSIAGHAILPALILLSTKQALRLSDRHFAVRDLAWIGVCVALSLECICISSAFLWRFPVPFREVLFAPLFMVFVALYMWLFGREELRRKMPKLQQYLPMVAMQFAMYYSFLSLAGAFTYISSTTQILLVVGFPVVKLLVKKAVWSKARKLDDLTTDVTICFVELTGALYQTVCLQFAKSQALQFVILFADFFQALYEVRAYVFHEYITDGVSTVHTAVQIVLSGVCSGGAESSTKSRDRRDRHHKRSSGTSSDGGRRARGARVSQFLVNAEAASSVFLKPKMVQSFQRKRLLDLNQYKYEVDLNLPETDPYDTAVAQPPPLQETDDTAHSHNEAHSGAGEASVSVAAGQHTHRTTAEPSCVSPRSAVSRSPSQYERRNSFTANDTEYGISRAETGSFAISSTALSPAQEVPPPSPPPAEHVAPPTSGSGDRIPATTPALPVLKLAKLPPLRRSSAGNASASQASSLRNISLLCDGDSKRNSRTAFSVYDPIPPLDPSDAASDACLPAARLIKPTAVPRSSSIMDTLVSAATEQHDAFSVLTTKRTSAPSFATRRLSKRGSAVHPGELEIAAVVADRENSPQQSVNATSAAHGSSTSRANSGVNRSKPVHSSGIVQPATTKTAPRTVTIRTTRVMIDGIQLPRKDQARILEQTLQLLFSCEVLIFVEFLEVLLPSLYALLVGGLWPLHNARYNLLFISMTHDGMLAAVGSSLAYAALESLSLVVLAVILKRRYGISALHLLAFVLEKYWKVLHGKMAGALLVVWLTLTVHQGVDFTFTYDYGVILERFGSWRIGLK